MLLYAMVALSLTVLTGWAGQLSLGQFAFVGLGAMTTAALVTRGRRLRTRARRRRVARLRRRDHHRRARAAHTRTVPRGHDARVRGRHVVVAALALVLPPRRRAPSRCRARSSAASRSRPSARTTRCASSRSSLVVIVVSKLRTSGFGRSLIAVRDNERAAASVGLSPGRVKLTAFAISGAIAGFAGGLLAGLYVTFGPERFGADRVVAGDLDRGDRRARLGVRRDPRRAVRRRYPGAVPDNANVALLTSGVGILVVLLFFPGGLAQILFSVRDVCSLASPVACRRPRPTRPSPRPRVARPGDATRRASRGAEPEIAIRYAQPHGAVRQRTSRSTTSTSTCDGARSSG